MIIYFSEKADDTDIYGSSNKCNNLVAGMQQAVDQHEAGAKICISVSAMYFSKYDVNINPIMITHFQVECYFI